jgi:hypothetical protein
MGRKFSRTRGPAAAAAGIALVVGGAGAAVAANTGWTSTTQTESGKASFAGSRLFYSNNDNHGGLRIKGTLKDLDKSNNRSVKFQVKIHGYSPTVYNAPEDANRSIPDKVHYDGAMTIVHYGQIQTCQRNVLADDCTSWRKYTNPYY